MISNVFIALITALSTLIAALGGAALGYYFNERKENKLKREKEKDLKRIANTELSNAQIEIFCTIQILEKLLALYDIGDYDYARMMNQVNKITIVEIPKFNNNIFLNKNQRSLARQMYIIKSIKENFELTLDLYNHKIVTDKMIKTTIDLSMAELKKIYKSSSRLLKE